MEQRDVTFLVLIVDLQRYMQPKVVLDYPRYIDHRMKAFWLKTPVSPKRPNNQSAIFTMAFMMTLTHEYCLIFIYEFYSTSVRKVPRWIRIRFGSKFHYSHTPNSQPLVKHYVGRYTKPLLYSVLQFIITRPQFSFQEASWRCIAVDNKLRSYLR